MGQLIKINETDQFNEHLVKRLLSRYHVGNQNGFSST